MSPANVTIPDYSMPLIGWRAWYVELDYRSPLKLRALNTSFGYWPAGTIMTAQCMVDVYPEFHQPPEQGPPYWRHSCGIYALSTVERLMRHHFVGGDDSALLYGPVALWGRIIKHRTGYRAQHAYPLAFVADPHEVTTVPKRRLFRRLEAIARKYKRPLTVLELQRQPDDLFIRGGFWLHRKRKRYSVQGSMRQRWPPSVIEQFRAAVARYTRPGVRIDELF